MKTRNILVFVGTRPEAIKMVPVIQELKRNKRFKVKVALSAQHRDMLDQVLKLFGVRADFDLNLMRPGQTLTDVTAGVLEKFGPVLDKARPDLVLVHGDTTTTMAGSLAAFYKKIPVGHVEAGLRTGDIYQPFPEEMNRRLTDSVATLFFPPTPEAKNHLKKENADSDHVFVTGNTVIDALLHMSRQSSAIHSGQLKKSLKKIGRKDFVLMTAHRRENFGKPFAEVCEGVRALSRRFPDLHWIYPVHPNPNILKPAGKILGRLPNVHLISPLDYADLVAAMKRCKLVVTDSGGLQEEAPSLGKPVLVLREVTERPEAVQAGTVKLVGASKNKLMAETSRLLTDSGYYRKMANAVNPYGDGRAAKRITQAISWYFGFTNKKPAPFGRRS